MEKWTYIYFKSIKYLRMTIHYPMLDDISHASVKHLDMLNGSLTDAYDLSNFLVLVYPQTMARHNANFLRSAEIWHLMKVHKILE